MSWRGTSVNCKARWTGSRPDRRAGCGAVRPCPRVVCILPFQKTSAKYGKRKGNRLWFGAPVNTGQQECVNVSDDEAPMRGPVYTFDLISVVPMVCMKLHYFYAKWRRCIDIAASLAISPDAANSIFACIRLTHVVARAIVE
jgi:hypothetical protein